MKVVEEYVASLGLDAYVVGGAVRDELLGRESKDADFLVPGMTTEQLRAALRAHGRIDDLLVAGQLVGVRLYPRDSTIRRIAMAGIEFAPVRRERSTGPGRHDFEIVVDPEGTVEDDLARRDFTINAIARHLGDGSIVDPHHGRDDLRDQKLRTVTPNSFAEDPLRIVRGLRFVSQFGFDPDEHTLSQMREHARAVAHVSGERIGGGIAADGLGELSKLLLGPEPRKALRIARDTGVLVSVFPEFGPAIGFDSHSTDHDMTLDEHIFAVVQAAADAGSTLAVRLATLFHDLGKPSGAPDHAAAGADIAAVIMRRLRYPNAISARVIAIARHHPVALDDIDARTARRFLASHGEELVTDLLAHWHADLEGRDSLPRVLERRERLNVFREVVNQELRHPYRLGDLAVDGADLIALGFTPGPPLGLALAQLLDDVVDEPGRNDRDTLLARAKELLHA